MPAHLPFVFGAAVTVGITAAIIMNRDKILQAYYETRQDFEFFLEEFENKVNEFNNDFKDKEKDSRSKYSENEEGDGFDDEKASSSSADPYRYHHYHEDEDEDEEELYHTPLVTSSVETLKADGSHIDEKRRNLRNRKNINFSRLSSSNLISENGINGNNNNVDEYSNDEDNDDDDESLTQVNGLSLDYVEINSDGGYSTTDGNVTPSASEAGDDNYM
ncbi:hypothetical protein PACTADRAFT_47645 [Pachysolen tannophilus NRRL Y-2460]|uniref:Uncharacterized protein n=1 Tax=Pachysolen tannophilus NRRL Y-2460 TaxID=669874 RepID=A0A1E4U1A8_PACTA|nr:hypothetical protein PACTADRAFT_47645 [Pachysolen tannophilus NRRL Y-2460]